MTANMVRKQLAPDTAYFMFKNVREQRDGETGTTTADIGESPISRWLSYSIKYSDFTVSNPTGATGYMFQCQIPRGTIMLRAASRCDVAFVGTGNNDIDVGDGNDPDGWLDGVDWSSTGGKFDPNAVYNQAGSTGGVFYEDGDTVDVLFKNATAPTAGEAILFLEVISYHEALGAE